MSGPNQYGGQEVQKHIIDANLDKANVVDFNTFATFAINTLDDIIEIIKPLCGKYALSDMVIYTNVANEFNSNVFSNDGIHVLKSIEFLSPIQSYIVNMIEYIARRVESAAADGTSTAIYFAASYMKKVLETILDNKKYSTDCNIDRLHRNMKNRSDLVKHVVKELVNIRKYIENITIHPKDVVPETKEFLIRQLAMTTGKGNKILADFAVAIFKDTPEVIYEFSYFKRSSIETEEELMVKYPDYDFCLNVNTSTKTYFNAELHTAVKYENCKLLILPYFITSVAPIIEYINKHKEEHIVILYKHMNDISQRELETAIDEKYVTLCKHTVSVPNFIENPVELLTLLAMSDKEDYSDLTLEVIEKNIIHDVSCYIKNNDMFVDRACRSIEGSYLHPNFISKDNALFNKFEKELREEIIKLRDGHKQTNNIFLQGEFVRIYRSMVCCRLPILTIGGNSTRHLANINVVEDVIGAVSVAMRYGFVLDGIMKLETAFNEKVLCNDSFMKDIVSDFKTITYGNTKTIKRHDAALFLEAEGYYDQDNKQVFGINKNLYRDNVQVVQSAKAFDETFRRMIEVIVEITKADRIVVPGGVLLGKTN